MGPDGTVWAGVPDGRLMRWEKDRFVEFAPAPKPGWGYQVLAMGFANTVSVDQMLNRRVRPWGERPKNERTMVAEVTITYLAEGRFPGDVTITSGIGRIGTSSWTILQSMHQQGRCIATCDTVVVCRTDNEARPLRSELRAALEELLIAR